MDTRRLSILARRWMRDGEERMLLLLLLLPDDFRLRLELTSRRLSER
jgi:hypothetical protein